MAGGAGSRDDGLYTVLIIVAAVFVWIAAILDGSDGAVVRFSVSTGWWLILDAGRPWAGSGAAHPRLEYRLWPGLCCVGCAVHAMFGVPIQRVCLQRRQRVVVFAVNY